MNPAVLVLLIGILGILAILGVKHLKLIFSNIQASKKGKVNVREISKTGREVSIGFYTPQDNGTIEVTKSKINPVKILYPYDKQAVYINSYGCPTILYTPSRKIVDLYSGGTNSLQLSEFDSLMAQNWVTAQASNRKSDAIDFMTKMIIVVAIVGSIAVSWYYGKDIPTILELLQKIATTL